VSKWSSRNLQRIGRIDRFGVAGPAVLDPEAIRAYLVYLTTEKQLAPSSVVIAVCALRFLYSHQGHMIGTRRRQSQHRPAGTLLDTGLTAAVVNVPCNCIQ